MSRLLYAIPCFGFVWSAVEIAAKNVFDGLVLTVVSLLAYHLLGEFFKEDV